MPGTVEDASLIHFVIYLYLSLCIKCNVVYMKLMNHEIG